MELLAIMRGRRSIRRFAQRPVPREAIAAMLEMARLAPTGTNMQPLCFAAVTSPERCRAIFPLTRWAALVPDGGAGPDAETQPAAYVLVLVDTQKRKTADADAGAACMSILLAAEAQGIASCWLGSVDRRGILAQLNDIDADRYYLHSVIALGYAAMSSRAVPMTDNSTAYYLEGPGRLCVPKRPATDTERWYE